VPAVYVGQPSAGRLGAVWASDFRSTGRGFDSGRDVIKSPRSTQPSIPPGQVNRVPALLAGVKAGCVCLYRVASNIVIILYGK